MGYVKLNGYEVIFYTEEKWNSLFRESLDFVAPFRDIMEHDHSCGKNEYVGLVSQVSEELAEKIVDKDLTHYELGGRYRDYTELQYIVKTAVMSLLTLSDLPYCVIVKL